MLNNVHYDLFVFDWDGTIVDSTSSIVAGIQYASEKMGCPVPSEELSRSVIGLGFHETIQIVAPELPEPLYEEYLSHYRTCYLDLEKNISLFPGIESLLRSMHGAGLRLAVATGKSRKGLNRFFEKTGLGSLFETSICADESASKPDPLMMKILLHRSAVKAERAVMIGDTPHDILLSKGARVDCMAVTYGATPRGKLEGFQPTGLADDVPQLASLLGLETLVR